MDTATVQLFTALLTIVAAVGAAVVLALGVVGRRHEGAQRALVSIGQLALWLGFLVAAAATLGSLYFSEVANFVPCRLCWFQRVAMYPLAVILLVAAIRRDLAVRWYAAPIALLGLAVSAYHYLLEWYPSLEGGSCAASGPLCSVVWFRELGFVTLAFMAGTGFITILALLFVALPAAIRADGLDHEAVEPGARSGIIEPVEQHT